MTARGVLVAVLVAGCGGGGQAPHDGAAIDASAAADSDGGLGSRCSASGSAMTCTSQAIEIDGRTVTYQVPLGAPPAAGWPSVIYYQGSFVAGSQAFSAVMDAAFGQYELTLTVKALLDGGYAVIAPDALDDGFWETNIPPFSVSWAGCADDVLVQAVLAATLDGTFGPLDPLRRYAMGISSGGFMTSRMAVSYDGTFRALAIASGSYATCSDICVVPDLPADHPPTLFLHGEADTIVPPSAMLVYRDKLVADGHVVDTVLDPTAGHQWLSEAVTAVPAWFDSH